MANIAIIGTGIAGMGCAEELHREHAVTVFEQADYSGGHTHTVWVEEDGHTLPVDTGFIVCNPENYPLLMELFERYNVPLKKTSMGFSAQVKQDNIEYSGSGLSYLFAQRKNILSPRYIRFLFQLNRFNKECVEVLTEEKYRRLSVAEYCALKKMHSDLLNWYILPMSSALWSTPPAITATFPVVSLVRFFKNHGFLGLHTQFQWYTVDGGSEVYKQKIISGFKERIQHNAKVLRVHSEGGSMVVTLQSGEQHIFDKVIIATHADQAYAMLDTAFHAQKKMLSPFQYQINTTTLHTDAAVMPKRQKVWSSWNYSTEMKDGASVSSCTYWMNSLQGVSDKQNYFLTINDHGNVHPDKIIRVIQYEHPVFTVEAMEMQEKLSQLNEPALSGNQLYFCGSYFKFGFHEDAYRSAREVCAEIKRTTAEPKPVIQPENKKFELH